MSVHAALVRPVPRPSRGRHAKPRPAWPRVAGRAVFPVIAVLCAVAVAGAGWPPVLLVVPAAALPLCVASARKLRTASRKIDTIFAEELINPESDQECDPAAEAADSDTPEAPGLAPATAGCPSPHFNV